MKAARTRATDRRTSIAAVVTRGVLWLVWQAIRLPLFSILLVFEPIVRWILSWTALLGVLTAFVFEYFRVGPQFSFLGMIGFSIGCAVVLTAYHALLRLLSR